MEENKQTMKKCIDIPTAVIATATIVGAYPGAKAIVQDVKKIIIK